MNQFHLGSCLDLLPNHTLRQLILRDVVDGFWFVFFGIFRRKLVVVIVFEYVIFWIILSVFIYLFELSVFSLNILLTLQVIFLLGIFLRGVYCLFDAFFGEFLLGRRFDVGVFWFGMDVLIFRHILPCSTDSMYIWDLPQIIIFFDKALVGREFWSQQKRGRRLVVLDQGIFLVNDKPAVVSPCEYLSNVLSCQSLDVCKYHSLLQISESELPELPYSSHIHMVWVHQNDCVVLTAGHLLYVLSIQIPHWGWIA